MQLAFRLGLLIAALFSAFLLFGPKDPRSGLVDMPVARAAPSEARIHYSSGHYPKLVMPDGSMTAVKSMLNVQKRMHYGDFAWNVDGIPAGPVWIRVDLRLQALSVFRAGHEIGSAIILYGTDGKATPTGVFPILQRAAQHRSTLYDADMPFMLRLTNDGVAIHASNVRAGAATHGCIGIPPEFAKLLFEQVRRGDLVAIMPEQNT
ncbi:L,D-transpeptidase family protein [Sphingomonas antarctica]|uniref:L,D-transpeptidase family protein n=1 Tax=Sphingomonas antarctica TaxID=2040274 RepID=UPI0039E87EE3